MAQAGFTPIQLFFSNTATNVPAALANGELAINQADGKLYYRNNAGTVTLFAPAVTAVSTISFGSTGLTPNTATSGAVTVAGILIAANGGTGIGSYLQGEMLFANTTTTLDKVSANTTLTKKFLSQTGNGTVGLAPAFAQPAATDITGLAASATTDTTDASNITSGILASARGGTSFGTYTTGDIIYSSATNTLAKLGIGTNGQVLTVNASGVPVWTTVTGTGTVTSVDVSGGTTGLSTSGGPITATGTITLAGTLVAANGGTGFSTYATGDLIYASATNTLAKLAAGTNGFVLTLAAGVPTWLASTGGTGDVIGPSSATDTAITLFDGTTGKLIKNSLVTVSSAGAIVAPQTGSVIPFYFANQASFPSAATYHGALAHSHADGAMYFAHSSAWVKLLDASTTVTVAQGGTGVTTSTGTGSVVLNTTPALTNPTVTNYTEQVFSATGSSFTIDLANGTYQALTLNANASIVLPSSVSGKSYLLRLTYTGSFSVTFSGGSTLKFPGGVTPTTTSANGKFDIFAFFCDGTNTYGQSVGLNY